MKAQQGLYVEGQAASTLVMLCAEVDDTKRPANANAVYKLYIVGNAGNGFCQREAFS